MRVVDSTELDLHSVPVKRRVTIRTPHLGAPTNLEDHGTALGTRLCILLEKGDSLNVIWIARMSVVVFDLITILTNVILTNLTLPTRRQEPSAVSHRALSNKYPFLN